MKAYNATFERFNPQLDRTYISTSLIHAKDKREARKIAESYCDCAYGSKTLVALELVKE